MEKAEENPGSRGDRPPNPRFPGEDTGIGKKAGGGGIQKKKKKKQKKQKKAKKKRKFFLTLFPFGCIFSLTVADDGRRQKPAGCLTAQEMEAKTNKVDMSA